MWTMGPSKGSTLKSRYKQQSNLKENSFPEMANFLKLKNMYPVFIALFMYLYAQAS